MDQKSDFRVGMVRTSTMQEVCACDEVSRWLSLWGHRACTHSRALTRDA